MAVSAAPVADPARAKAGPAGPKKAAAGKGGGKSQQLASRPASARTEKLYSNASDIQAKLEAKRAEKATEGCTFKPQLSKKAASGKIANSRTGSVYDHLHSTAKKTQEKIKAASESKPNPNFKPVIATTKSPYAKSAKPKILAEKQESTIAAIESEAYKECSFRPKLASRAVSEKLVSGRTGSAMDRLYAGPEALKKKEEKLRMEKEKKDLEECTFAPVVKAPASIAVKRESSTPVHERLYGEAHMSEERLRRRQAERDQEELQECTFQPAVSTAPGDSGWATQEAGDVHSRLFTHATESAARRMSLGRRGSLTEGCTFQPQIDPNSASIALRSSERFDELYEKGKAYQRERSMSPRDHTQAIREQLELEEMKECTFRPDRSPTAQSPSSKAVERSTGPAWARLHEDAKSFELAKERLRMEEQARHSFKPDVSLTAAESTGTPAWTRLNEDAIGIENRKERLRSEAQAAIPFKPDLALSSPRSAAKANRKSEASAA